MSDPDNRRVLSGMRPTGSLHLGHYHGVLKNWLQLQQQYECFFFVADWHALTTEYEDTKNISTCVIDMVADWLAVGIDPGNSVLFIQSWVPEHAELHLLLSMCTPISWLERMPSYKDQQEKLSDRDLSTYGFLGYPLLQTADILLYKAGQVPVGSDQEAHVELAREIARRFNFLYGREPDFEEKVARAQGKLSKKNMELYKNLRREWQQKGNQEALEKARLLLGNLKNISIRDRERLRGYLEGSGRMIFPEPEALLTVVPKMPGLDGQKMSKSYNNTLPLGVPPNTVNERIKAMPTDPARVRLSDPGRPENCPVWELHQIYTDESTRKSLYDSCMQASIGCLECKKHIIDGINTEQKEFRKRAEEYKDPDIVLNILREGSQTAREIARQTIDEIQSIMGLHYG